jgi:Gluconate 2-dehydrogenase subunit 3
MERRTLLKIASVLPAAGLADAATPTHCSTSGVGTDFADYRFAFFNAAEQALLDLLMEIIIPADEHSPGAHAARVPAFADLMLSTGPEEARNRWRSGLAAFRAAAEKGRLEDVAHRAALEEQHPRTELGRFFVDLKRMTVDGYYTSSIGIHQELGYQGNEYRKAAPACDHPEHGAR